jgi:hypothetical protein
MWTSIDPPCFVPIGGKKKGAPHFTKGMYGTFTVE